MTEAKCTSSTVQQSGGSALHHVGLDAAALSKHEPRTTNHEPGPLSRLLRRRVLARLSGLTGGTLTIHDALGSVVLGSTVASDGLPLINATLRVHHDGLWVALGLGGTVGAADAYIRGWWDSDDLTAVVRMLARNSGVLTALDGGLVELISSPIRRVLHWFNRNTIEGAKRNIAAHYDLGNGLFERMLDPTMLYSSAVFPHVAATLEEAQLHKCELICERLELKSGEHLLEIGTGWGYFAIHAARTRGVRVTTTTISREQYAVAVQRVAAAGLSDRIQVVRQDYRSLHGSFDKLVSIEMIEAVGWQHYPEYFAACSRLLKPQGLALIQAITIADQEYERAKRDVDVIKRFIFPGSCIPSVTALTTAATRHSDLRLTTLDDHTPHYARTLAMWRANCQRESVAIAALGYDQAFRRMWNFYLCYCEGGFAERAISVTHLLFAKPAWRQSGHRALGYA